MIIQALDQDGSIGIGGNEPLDGGAQANLGIDLQLTPINQAGQKKVLSVAAFGAAIIRTG